MNAQSTFDLRREEGRMVALALRIGAYGSFALITAGFLLAFIFPIGEWVARAGLLVLLFTPLVRIVIALVMFAREGDRKYLLVSAGVLAIVVTTSALALLGLLPTAER